MGKPATSPGKAQPPFMMGRLLSTVPWEAWVNPARCAPGQGYGLADRQAHRALILVQPPAPDCQPEEPTSDFR